MVPVERLLWHNSSQKSEIPLFMKFRNSEFSLLCSCSVFVISLSLPTEHTSQSISSHTMLLTLLNDFHVGTICIAHLVDHLILS